ncbi:hypothetical protein O5D80_006024 [Batrachochytrium dendrobatidis]|nr:hypothetical protein O5D80_006024 [Batrachochytrium dendrobatidis]
MTVLLPASQSKHQLAVLALLHRESPDQVCRAVRFIKNAIIGNPTKKQLYLHSLHLSTSLLECLKIYSNQFDLCTEIAIVIACLANGGSENVNTLVEAGAIPPLLNTLLASDLKLVNAGVRALRSIVQYPSLVISKSFETSHIKILSRLVSDTDSNASPLVVHIAEVAAGTLARISEYHTDMRDSIATSGAVASLIRWLDPQWSSTPRVQEAALDTLATLCHNNSHIAKLIASATLPNGHKIIDVLFALVRDKRPTMRMAASTCLTYIHCASCIPRSQYSSVLAVLLPTIIKLFGDTSPNTRSADTTTTAIGERSLVLFAELVAGSDDLQAASIEADAIAKLAQIINTLMPVDGPTTQGLNAIKQRKSTASWETTSSTAASLTFGNSTTRQLEFALLAIANVCSLKEECRKQVIDVKLLPQIVTYLGHKNVGIRKNACKCARSLSRSVKMLRTSLMDAGLAPPLFELLFDSDIEVQIEASATLCNIVLDFSPMKKIVLEKGGVKRLVELIDQPDAMLRRNALWALKNMLFQTDSITKNTVMEHLGWDKLLRLLDDEDIVVQEQALNLVRNAACGNEQDVEVVFNGFRGTDLLGLLERKLSTMPSNHDIVTQILYIVVNLAIGTAERKASIMSKTELLKRVFEYMDHEHTEIRLASVWCAINLTWIDDENVQSRVMQLCQLGLEDLLTRRLNDESLDVKDRAKTALANIQGLTQPAVFPATAPHGGPLSMSSSIIPDTNEAISTDRPSGTLL